MARIFNRDTRRVTELHMVSSNHDYLDDMIEDECFDLTFYPTDVPSCDFEMDGKKLDELTKYVNASNYINALYEQADGEQRALIDDIMGDHGVFDVWEPVRQVFDAFNIRR
jgi:hypothetical protein